MKKTLWPKYKRKRCGPNIKKKLRLSKLNTFIPLKAKEAQRVEIECCEASKKVVAVLHDHDLILKRKTNETLN